MLNRISDLLKENKSFAFETTLATKSYKQIIIEAKNKGYQTSLPQNSKKTSYSFTDTGKWQVKYIASNGTRSDSIMKTITIRPKLEAGFLGDDINFCEISPFPVALHAPRNLHCIHWYNDNKIELAKVDSVIISKEGTYYAKATNLSFCVEWDTIKITNTQQLKNLKITKSLLTLSSNEDHLRYIWLRDNLKISDTTKTIPLTKTGTYKLYAYTKFGCWVYSNEIIITDVSIEHLKLENFITVYPNPGKGKINIDINKVGIYSIKLYSTDGKLLYEKLVKAFETETLIHKLPKGEYFLIIQNTEGNSFNKRILVE
jgi:PKD repeat protein